MLFTKLIVINSLYKHNFIDSHIGSESTYNLNKNKGIYDELFTQNHYMRIIKVTILKKL